MKLHPRRQHANKNTSCYVLWDTQKNTDHHFSLDITHVAVFILQLSTFNEPHIWFVMKDALHSYKTL